MRDTEHNKTIEKKTKCKVVKDKIKENYIYSHISFLLKIFLSLSKSLIIRVQKIIYYDEVLDGSSIGIDR